MKTSHWTLGVMFVGFVGMASACSAKKAASDSSTTVGTGGTATTSTGKGGSTVNGPTTTSAGGGTTTATTGSGGGNGCDTGAKGKIGDQVCTDCIGCAQQGPCNDKAVACFQGNTDCNTYRQCLVGCIGTCDTNKNMSIDMGAETDCFNACAGDDTHMGAMTCQVKFAAGAKAWLGYINCAYYDTCGNNCGVGGLICDSGWTNTSKTCADCLGKNCCKEFTDCFKDANCKLCLPDPMKQATACNATMLDEAANGCEANKCGMACGGK